MDLTAEDLAAAEASVAALVRDSSAIVPTGAGTHKEVGGPVPTGTPVRAPAGIVTYDPAELTVTLGAGTTVANLTQVLADAGQECPLDPREAQATVGGTLSTGLSGHRRLRYGPIRDRVLEVRFVTGDGHVVRGGGPTVKNVTGFDLPRLLIGSLGTIGVLTRLILRCQPRAAVARWGASSDTPDVVRARCFGPSALLWDGTITHVLFEGHPDDVEAEHRGAGTEPIDDPPVWPTAPHRGRASVVPSKVTELGRALDELDGVRWLAEGGVGTVHVAADSEDGLAAARSAAQTAGGWLLREAGAPGLDGFGGELPNADLMARIKSAFDPEAKLAPGRMTFRPESSPDSRDRVEVSHA
jgi:glycolate oxidase FAD binding subunit